jgi:hypothetical protein
MRGLLRKGNSMDIGMVFAAGINMAYCLLDHNWIGAMGWFVAGGLFFSKFIEKTKE